MRLGKRKEIRELKNNDEEITIKGHEILEISRIHYTKKIEQRQKKEKQTFEEVEHNRKNVQIEEIMIEEINRWKK